MGGTISNPWASQGKCDYCDNTEHVRTFTDRTGQEPAIHICRDCYESGAEPKLKEMLEEPETHREEHVAHICIRQESDFPHSPIDIHRPKEEQNWWDITFVVLVRDDKPIDVVIADWRKSP